VGGIETQISECERLKTILGCDIFDPVVTGIISGISKLFGGALDAEVGKGNPAEVGFD